MPFLAPLPDSPGHRNIFITSRATAAAVLPPPAGNIAVCVRAACSTIVQRSCVCFLLAGGGSINSAACVIDDRSVCCYSRTPAHDLRSSRSRAGAFWNASAASARHCCITDGGGKVRTEQSQQGLDSIGLAGRVTYLGFGETEFYRALLRHDLEFFREVAAALRSELERLQPKQLFAMPWNSITRCTISPFRWSWLPMTTTELTRSMRCRWFIRRSILTRIMRSSAHRRILVTAACSISSINASLPKKGMHSMTFT